MNTRCHLKGSGVCDAVANRQRKERRLCNSRGHDLLGEVVFFCFLQWLGHFFPDLGDGPLTSTESAAHRPAKVNESTFIIEFLSRF